MKKQNLFISDLHFEHEQWKLELSFWADEIKTFENRLEELVNRWTDQTVLAELESFQNQFMIHKGVIEEMQHFINVHETEMSNHDMKAELVLNTDHYKEHVIERSKMETQRHIYSELKKNFFHFLTKYM